MSLYAIWDNLFSFFLFFFLFQYNFIERTHVQLTFTKDNLQQQKLQLEADKKETKHSKNISEN